MVTCKICGQQMNWIQNTHLRKHHTTLEQYRKDYPGEATITESMHDEIVRTRMRVHRTPIKICARPGCGMPVKNWKENIYCSCSCSAKINVYTNLKQFATSEGNPGYTDGDYSHNKNAKVKAFDLSEGICMKCGKLLDGKESRYGVHHLIPRKLIQDKELADSLRNLTVLCSVDHKEVESRFASIIYELYMSQDYKTTEELMDYIRLKI